MLDLHRDALERTPLGVLQTMTTQIPETILFRGKTYDMLAEPLDVYFELMGIEPSPHSVCSALWRGYVGEWEITQDRLYLRKLMGSDEDDPNISMERFFPGFGDRVFAHWYSGDLRLEVLREVSALPDDPDRNPNNAASDLIVRVRRGQVWEILPQSDKPQRAHFSG